jgi:hypothetical protein
MKKVLKKSGPALEHDFLQTDYKRSLKMFHAALAMKTQAEKSLKIFYKEHPEFQPKSDQTSFLKELFP